VLIKKSERERRREKILKTFDAMDKLLLSLSLIASVLTSMTVNSAPMQTSKLISSIDPLQKRYNYFLDDGSTTSSSTPSSPLENESELDKQQQQQQQDTVSVKFDETTLKKDDNSNNNNNNLDNINNERFMFKTPALNTRTRQNKMIGFYPTAAVNPYPFGYSFIPPAVYYPPEFYDDFSAFFDAGFGGEEDEIMSRQNPGNRRRPLYKNSPIYYIRLPPQPYMFIPGLGYVSQPPTYHPMSLPPPQPQPSPFYNLPLDFISNGKPTNIYQWGSPGIAAAYMPQQPPPPPQYGSYPSAPAPSYSTRPQRPYSQRPINPYIQDSKVTSLKGQFLFNGRPEEIFILPTNSYSSIYNDPRYPSDPRYGNNYY
jgi:hypothetical protein